MENRLAQLISVLALTDLSKEKIEMIVFLFKSFGKKVITDILSLLEFSSCEFDERGHKIIKLGPKLKKQIRELMV